MPPKAAKKCGEGIFWTDSAYFSPRFTGLQGGGHKSVLGGGVWKISIGGGVHNPDLLRAQVWQLPSQTEPKNFARHNTHFWCLKRQKKRVLTVFWSLFCPFFKKKILQN